MAVSAAMLRPPGGGLEPQFYPSPRMNYSPTEDAKSKKSWGQRLKLSPGVGSPSGRSPAGASLYGTVSGPGGSALSKSMKYAEPWLYGTVRGGHAPSRPGLYLQYADAPSPVLISTPQPPVQNYAVVVCSCQEYLNGTKKSSTKKVSICKKCKGSRLPLGVAIDGTIRGQMVGGTVRGPQAVRAAGGTVRAGTVKLTTASKSRPTILSLTPQNQTSDPYDLMRRTRLSSPLESAHVGSQFTASRSRAKSISPVRNRGRRRSPSSEAAKGRSKSVSRSKDLWYEEVQCYDGDYNSRRSILECDVNPYDLMHRMKVEKLRQHREEDEDDAFADFENDETFSLKKLKENLSDRQSKKGAKHNGPYSSVQAIGGQRIRVFGQSSTQNGEDDFVYDDVEVNGQIDYSKKEIRISNEPKQSEQSLGSFSRNGLSEQKTGTMRPPKIRSASPKRPPRRVRTETSEEESESDRRESEQKTVTKQSAVNNSSAAFVANRSSADAAIKSILKKPRAEDSPPPISSHPTMPAPPASPRLSGSHFYLPTPPAPKPSSPAQAAPAQRKKVQFLVENEIVSSSTEDLSGSPTSRPSADIVTVNEVPLSNNERKSSLQLYDEGAEALAASGSHNLVSAHNAKNISYIDNSGSAGDYDETAADARSQSQGSEAGWVEQPAEAGEGSDILVRMYSQGSADPASAVQADSQGDDSQEETSDEFSAARAVLLRRSQSERLIVQGSPEPPTFLDTMALRHRPPRAHSRQAFVSTQSLVEIINTEKPTRPRERPPPPPPPSPPSPPSPSSPPTPSTETQRQNSSSITIVCGNKMSHVEEGQPNQTSAHFPVEPDLRHSVRLSTQPSNSGPEPAAADRPQSAFALRKGSQKATRVVEALPAAPPRSKPKEVKVVKPTKKEPNYVKTRFVRDKNVLEEVSTVAFDADDRSTIQISSETSSNGFGSPGVHRLSITQNDEHDDEEERKPTEGGQRKTSIMINGDDCYSTMNVNNDTPIYQSSVTVNDATSPSPVKNTGNTVTISVFSESDDSSMDMSSRHSNQIYIHNKTDSSYKATNLNQSVASSPTISSPGKTLVVVDYETVNADDMKAMHQGKLRTNLFSSKVNSDKDKKEVSQEISSFSPDSKTTRGTRCNENVSDMNSASEELSIILRNPVEAVKRNLVPHVCGKAINDIAGDTNEHSDNPIKSESELKSLSRNSFIAKLLEDPMLGSLAEGLESDLVAKLIENSLIRLKSTRSTNETKDIPDEEAMSRLIDASLLKLQEERSTTSKLIESMDKNDDLINSSLTKNFDDNGSIHNLNKNSVCSQAHSTENSACSPPYESMEYESGLIGASSDAEPLSDCYNASASELSTEEENSTRSKFYQMLVDATLSEIEISNNNDDDHHYESIRLNSDPIYEEIGDIPPPLPLNPPPASLSIMDEDKKLMTRSIFEGASKYDILSYLVDAKERGIVPEDSYTFNFNTSSDIIGEEEVESQKDPIDHQRQSSDLSSRVSNLSNGSDSSEDSSLIITNDKASACKKSSADIERNDSGVGSETSKCSRSRWQGHNIPPSSVLDNSAPIHICEDCDGAVETQVTDSGVMYAPLVCRKCGKKRAERKEIITEIVETEEKYGRDLQIILEEFYQPMLVAGLLTQEQLSAIFLNVEELLENNQTLAERLRDALEIAVEQGDEDLLTVNIGKLFLEAAPMLPAFSAYCVRQGAASLLLAGLEKEKELLRIFLKVSQMENAVLRRMNLNSFLMVPVQRVTKYPLLLSRLFKVTPPQLEGRDLLRQAQQRIELHLSHMNSETKDVTSLRLWRRISSGAGRRTSSEMDMINIKLRKMAVDVLDWNHDEARFAIEGKLLFTQPNDNNWRKGRTIKLTPINALLVTNGKPTAAYKPGESLGPSFPRNTGVREASLLLVREKAGRAALLREPLYLDRCVVAADGDWDDYFELQEIVSKDTYIFKAEDSARTKLWCQQLQYHCQGMGAWRKRRNALANIMINGMMSRT